MIKNNNFSIEINELHLSKIKDIYNANVLDSKMDFV